MKRQRTRASSSLINMTQRSEPSTSRQIDVSQYSQPSSSRLIHVSQRSQPSRSMQIEESRRSPESTSSSISDRTTQCVRYILGRDSSKIPLKRADIAKHLSATSETSSQVQAVIDNAAQVLKKVYGYNLVQEKHKTGVVYMVVLAEGEEPDTRATPLEMQYQPLLNAVLAHTFMSGGEVDSEDMWKFLRKAKLLDDNEKSTKKIVTHKFVAQMYLTLRTRGTGDRATTSIEWGPRAHKEVSKMFMLQKIAMALEKSPDYWHGPYTEAQKDVAAGRPVQEAMIIE